MPKVVFTLKSTSAQTTSLSGTKGAILAKMTKANLPIPPGFVISTKAFQTISHKISTKVKTFKNLDTSDPNALQQASDDIRKIIVEHDPVAKIALLIAAGRESRKVEVRGFIVEAERIGSGFALGWGLDGAEPAILAAEGGGL